MPYGYLQGQINDLPYSRVRSNYLMKHNTVRGSGGGRGAIPASPHTPPASPQHPHGSPTHLAAQSSYADMIIAFKMRSPPIPPTPAPARGACTGSARRPKSTSRTGAATTSATLISWTQPPLPRSVSRAILAHESRAREEGQGRRGNAGGSATSCLRQRRAGYPNFMRK